jgi:hypothetical protein
MICLHGNFTGIARNGASLCSCIYSDIIMAEEEEGKEYRWETGYEKTW